MTCRVQEAVGTSSGHFQLRMPADYTGEDSDEPHSTQGLPAAIKPGLTTSDVDEKAPPPPLAGLVQRPRPMSSHLQRHDSDSEEHSAALNCLEISWI